MHHKMSDLTRMKILVLLPDNKRVKITVEVEKKVWDFNKRLVMVMNVNKWYAQKNFETVNKRVVVRKT